MKKFILAAAVIASSALIASSAQAGVWINGWYYPTCHIYWNGFAWVQFCG